MKLLMSLECVLRMFMWLNQKDARQFKHSGSVFCVLDIVVLETFNSPCNPKRRCCYRFHFINMATGPEK